MWGKILKIGLAILPVAAIGVAGWAVTDMEARVQVILMIVLVSVTGYYAFATSRIAKANVTMAKEMRQQRFATSQPILVATPHDLVATLRDLGPRNLVVLVENVGNGPALSLEISAEAKGREIEKKKETTVAGKVEAIYGEKPGTEKSYTYGPIAGARPLAAGKSYEVRIPESVGRAFTSDRAIFRIKCYYGDAYDRTLLSTSESHLDEQQGFVHVSTTIQQC